MKRMDNRAARSNRISGFTLVELMVALVLGLIVIGAILTFTISSIQVNSTYVRSTKLQQELRNALSYVAGELKRAGYDDKAVNRVANPSNPPSPYSAISLVNANCILYAYDRPDPTVTTTLPAVVSAAQGELRGIRRVVLADGRGAIEVAESTASAIPACNSSSANYSTYPASCTGGWCPLTDPRVFDVTQLRFTLNANSLSSPPLGLVSRDLKIWMQGRLTGGDQDVVRALDTTIKVRTDCIRLTANTGQCGLAPAI